MAASSGLGPGRAWSSSMLAAPRGRTTLANSLFCTASLLLPCCCPDWNVEARRRDGDVVAILCATRTPTIPATGYTPRAVAIPRAGLAPPSQSALWASEALPRCHRRHTDDTPRVQLGAGSWEREIVPDSLPRPRLLSHERRQNRNILKLQIFSLDDPGFTQTTKFHKS